MSQKKMKRMRKAGVLLGGIDELVKSEDYKKFAKNKMLTIPDIDDKQIFDDYINYYMNKII